MTKRLLLLSALGLMSSGCATSLADLRARPPIRSGVVPGAYDALARCAVDGANSLPKTVFLTSASDHVYQLVDYRPTPRAAVTGYDERRAASAVAELLFTPVDAATTQVDLRLSVPNAAAQRRYERELWGVVETCGGASQTR